MKAAVAKRVRWTVRDYFRMAEAGLLDDRRVELINGEIVEMPAQASAHRASITKISKLLLAAFTASDWVVIQGTFLLPLFGAPDPDFHVFGVPVGTPDKQLPPPLLLIEVSDSTYLKDSGPKLRMYARAGVPDYWIVNIPQDRVEVYRQPENPTGRRSGWRYADVRFYSRGEQVTSLRRPSVTLLVDDLLP